MRIVKFEDSTESFYSDLIAGKNAHGNFKKPLDQLKDLKKKYPCGQFEYRFLILLIHNFDRLILMRPPLMEKWIRRIDSCCGHKFYSIKKTKEGSVFEQTKFGMELSKALAYKKLQNKVLKEFFHSLNQLKSCYYCNSQYTLTFKKGKKEAVKFQIDHIYPKKKYPYFSISLYNLIPSCASCNLNKGDKDYWLKDYAHPYLESVSELFKFTLIKESDKSDYTFGGKVDLDDFEISITDTNNPKVKNHDDLFDIQGIYGNFKEIAKEIIELGHEYPESKRNELLRSYKGSSGHPMFEDRESIDRLFLRVYPNPKDINLRPLSKFIQDMTRFSDFYDS